MRKTLKSSSDYIILFLYAACMYLLWKLCLLGDLRYWMRIMLPFAILLTVLVVIRLVLRARGYKASHFKVRMGCFVAITLIFAAMIIHTAIPYNGALSWKVDDYFNHKKIEFTHNNIYEDGINGVLDDIDRKISLPDKLYVSEDFYISFKEDGSITNVEALIYGKDDKGQLKGYLISYDKNKESKINVWLNDGEGISVSSDKLLEPFVRILEKSDAHYKEQVKNWNFESNDKEYAFLYSGKTKVSIGEEFYILDLIEKNSYGLTKSELSEGGQLSGYQASLFVPNKKEISPVKYLVDSKYVSREELEAEHDSGVVKNAKTSESWIVDEANGTVYSFVLDDKKIGYRLVVVNAAAGSRFYKLDKSIDSGQSWDVINENPFMDEAGVAEGIVFFSNDFGFIGIQGASGESSQIYMTKDAGITFKRLEIPMDKVPRVPKSGKEMGLKLDDYRYISMPKLKSSKLYITVTAGYGEIDGIDFYSEDNGESWNVLTK